MVYWMASPVIVPVARCFILLTACSTPVLVVKVLSENSGWTSLPYWSKPTRVALGPISRNWSRLMMKVLTASYSWGRMLLELSITKTKSNGEALQWFSVNRGVKVCGPECCKNQKGLVLVIVFKTTFKESQQDLIKQAGTEKKRWRLEKETTSLL